MTEKCHIYLSIYRQTFIYIFYIKILRTKVGSCREITKVNPLKIKILILIILINILWPSYVAYVTSDILPLAYCRFSKDVYLYGEVVTLYIKVETYLQNPIILIVKPDGSTETIKLGGELKTGSYTFTLGQAGPPPGYRQVILKSQSPYSGGEYVEVSRCGYRVEESPSLPDQGQRPTITITMTSEYIYTITSTKTKRVERECTSTITVITTITDTETTIITSTPPIKVVTEEITSVTTITIIKTLFTKTEINILRPKAGEVTFELMGVDVENQEVQGVPYVPKNFEYQTVRIAKEGGTVGVGVKGLTLNAGMGLTTKDFGINGGGSALAAEVSLLDETIKGSIELGGIGVSLHVGTDKIEVGGCFIAGGTVTMNPRKALNKLKFW